jgi:hypothetical protein
MGDLCVVAARTPFGGTSGRPVWDVLDGGALPSIADHVLAVTDTPDGQHWSVLLNGSRVDWIQQSVRTGERELSFEQVTGDLAQLHGNWTLHDGHLSLTIRFHLGVDGLAPLLDPIWTQSFQAHADALVRAVAEAAQPPEQEGTA